MSPENLHPFGASTCAGPAMDSQILRDLFAHVAEAAQILLKDAAFRREVLAARAAQKSLDLRGDLSTGWAIGWRINLWARLGDGDRTHRILKLLLDPSRTYPNLFDAHPPFQIDGNFGGTNGMAEMIVQSRPGEIEILPALPSAWPEGWLKGVRLRGALALDLTWAGGKPTQVVLTGPAGARTRVRYRETVQEIVLPRSGRLSLSV